MAATIDTLEILREPQDAGMPERQAEAVARVVKKRYDLDREEMVTREYLDLALAKQSAELRAEMADIRASIADVHVSIAKLERDLLVKLGAIITVAVVGGLGVLF